MRAVIQLVSSASVRVEKKLISSIEKGFLVLLGIASDDHMSDIEWLSRKISDMRIFSDGEKMNLSIKDVNGSIIVVSQFTLMAQTKKGNRPSFVRAAPAEQARVLYDNFVEVLNKQDIPSYKGQFQAHMEIELCNDGPVTIIIDSKNRDL